MISYTLSHPDADTPEPATFVTTVEDGECVLHEDGEDAPGFWLPQSGEIGEHVCLPCALSHGYTITPNV